MKHTRKSIKRHAGTRKQIGNKVKMGGVPKRVNQEQFDMLIKKMLELLTSLKLYHWNTISYSTHKATDDIHGQLSDKMDEYVEMMIGKSNRNYRINMSHFNHLMIKGVSNNTQMEMLIKSFINEIVSFHAQLPQTFYSDVSNIKDEIVGSLNKFLYLLTLK
jgi:DNA-binding ferritin-like protein